MYDKSLPPPSASSLVGDGDDISGNEHPRACAHLPESSSTMRQTPIINASGRRSLRPKLNVKTAAIISVLVFCAVYSTLLDLHYQQMYQRLYNDRDVSSFDAPQQEEVGATHREEEDGQNSSLGIGAQYHHQQVQQQQEQQNNTKDLPKHATPSFKVDAYSFPTVQERLQYYMGDWFNKTGWSVPDCSFVKEEHNHNNVVYDQVHLLTTTTIKQCMYSGLSTSKNNIGNTYCKDAYSFINTTEASRSGRDDAHWLFGFGDGIAELGNQLPIITKARPSLLSSDHPKTPLWLLNKNRHYGELDRYHNEVVHGEKGEVPWSEKIPKLFWRGSTTGNRARQPGHRLDFLTQWVHHNDDKIDIGFNNIVQMTSKFQHEYIERHYSDKGKRTRKWTSLHDMNRYKYLLSIEGNDVASGLKWMLYSNSVVFMSRPTVATWAMEDLLIPFVHYIPVANDYSNLLAMVHWAEEHDDACQEISRRATEYIEHLWISDQAKRDTELLQKEMATMYTDQFDHALSRCSSKVADESVKDP
jgi:hypothetical protein